MNQGKRRSLLDGVSQFLIHHAARRAPECLSSRLEEEWLADLEARSPALSGLSFALGCCWATAVIANEYPRSPFTSESPAAATRGLIKFADQNFNYFSLRASTLFLIVGLHAALFCGLISIA